MTELDETALQIRLRALKVAPPDTGFERSLIQALASAQPPVAPPGRTRKRFAQLVAAGVLLIGTSAAAWFTGVPVFQSVTDTRSVERNPKSSEQRKRARVAQHVVVQAPPSDAPPAVQPPVEPVSVAAPPAEIRTNTEGAGRIRRAVKPAAPPPRREPAFALPPEPAPQAVQVIAPERLSIGIPQAPVAGDTRFSTESRTPELEARGREVARERLADRAENAPNFEHGERRAQDNAARERRRGEGREKREHPIKN